MSFLHPWCCAHFCVRCNRSLDLQRAVESIPAYVEASRFFCVLAPTVDHADVKDEITGKSVINDFSSWSRRGWCRLEAMARLLSRNSGPVIVIVGKDIPPRLMPNNLPWILRCGHGIFTCCQRDHKLEIVDESAPGGMKVIPIPCDKVKVGATLKLLMSAKLQLLRAQLDHLHTRMEREKMEKENSNVNREDILSQYRFLLASW